MRSFVRKSSFSFAAILFSLGFPNPIGPQFCGFGAGAAS
jgi:hypothetical protein